MCECLEKMDEHIILESKKHLVQFGYIVTTSKEGVETNHGFGIVGYNENKTDAAFSFKYCPWCGKLIGGL